MFYYGLQNQATAERMIGMSKDRVEAVERALAVLNAFHADKPTMTLGEIASATGFYKSTILRLAGSLERLGYLIREERGAFRLGPALWRLGSIYRAGFNLGEAIRPELRRLVEATGEQHQRVEVSLHRHAPLDLISRKSRIDGPIEADGIDRNIFYVTQERSANATRKSDYLGPGYVAAHFRNNARRGIDAPSLELVRRQNAGPGIENLHGVRTCLQLPDQITGGRIDQLVDELGKSIRIPIGKAPCRLLL